VCFLHSSLSLSPSILELTVRLLARLISQNVVRRIFSARHVRPLVSEVNECIQKPPSVLLIDGSAFGPRKASEVEKTSSRGVSSFHHVVPIASTSSLAHALALSAHMYVCLLLSFAWLPHCCSFPELGPMTQTDLSASLWLHVNINEQIELETLHGTGSLENPL